jgi:polyisoprenoid-binding protein YceI
MSSLFSGLLPFLAMGAAHSEPSTYTLNTADSTLYVKVYKDAEGMGAALAHNHAVAATGWTGTATWDPEDLSACKLSISLPVSGLDADPSSLRKIAGKGFESEIGDGMRGDIKKNMLSEEQLWESKHKTITFESTGCSPKGEFAKLSGKFTLRGVTKTISLPVSVKAGETFTIKGNFNINATDFGFQPYSAMFGQIANENQMNVSLNLSGSK